MNNIRASVMYVCLFHPWVFERSIPETTTFSASRMRPAQMPQTGFLAATNSLMSCTLFSQRTTVANHIWAHSSVHTTSVTKHGIQMASWANIDFSSRLIFVWFSFMLLLNYIEFCQLQSAYWVSPWASRACRPGRRRWRCRWRWTPRRAGWGRPHSQGLRWRGSRRP